MITKLLKESFSNYQNNNAFCIQESFYTYKELEEVVNNIYKEIISCNFKVSIKIGIVTSNTIQTYASILACWFSGNSYVPLNPRIPKERNVLITKDANVLVVLGDCEETLLDFLNIDEIKIICTSELRNSKLDFFNPVTFKDDTLLYTLFTSGSTGLPKGVPIRNKNINSFLDSYNTLGFKSNSEDRFLQMFDLTFDVSVASYLVPLLIGACIYTVPSDGLKYMNVYKTLRDHKITFASIVPSIVTYLKPYFNEVNLPHLKYCILTAEASNTKVIQEWQKSIPKAKIVNLYGPTEATIWCSVYEYNAATEKSYNDMMIIGKPFKNVEVLILNESGVELPNGSKGELNISSDQLTDGYLNNNEKNIESFFMKNGKRFYKTGDLCYIDENGDIFYCGRIDHQIKVQGFRIELSEIEVAVRDKFKRNNLAVSYKNKVGVESICLFVEANYNISEEIKNMLASKLPYYMQPAQIRIIESFPYNTSNKIDRVKLSQLATEYG
jgi:D-alanine--poly(phosphoribitol) ligase subunit 1